MWIYFILETQHSSCTHNRHSLPYLSSACTFRHEHTSCWTILETQHSLCNRHSLPYLSSACTFFGQEHTPCWTILLTFILDISKNIWNGKIEICVKLPSYMLISYPNFFFFDLELQRVIGWYYVASGGTCMDMRQDLHSEVVLAFAMTIKSRKVGATAWYE